jgi:hypothetical protein
MLDPRMNGHAVEPMAEAAVGLTTWCTMNGFPHDCGETISLPYTFAGASAKVNHRIVPRDPAALADLPPDQLNEVINSPIPVMLSFSLYTQATGVDASTRRPWPGRR